MWRFLACGASPSLDIDFLALNVEPSTKTGWMRCRRYSAHVCPLVQPSIHPLLFPELCLCF